MGSTESNGRAPRLVVTQSGVGQLVLQEELDHPDWEISAQDRADRKTAAKTCAAHLSDLRRNFQTKLSSYVLADEDHLPLLR